MCDSIKIFCNQNKPFDSLLSHQAQLFFAFFLQIKLVEEKQRLTNINNNNKSREPAPTRTIDYNHQTLETQLNLESRLFDWVQNELFADASDLLLLIQSTIGAMVCF